MDNGWDDSAAAWIDDMGERGDFSREFILDPALKARIALKTFANALDVGCGEGRFCRLLEGLGIAATGIDFRIGGNRAFYVPSQDYVQVPPPQAYFEPINWHRTALHEMGHATGHASRLGRDFSGGFGTKTYAFEELIAEISSAFCCASLGIVPTVRHADYIGSWLEVMREDSRAIVRAASQASKAADWLLAHLPDDSTDVDRQTPTEGRTAA